MRTLIITFLAMILLSCGQRSVSIQHKRYDTFLNQFKEKDFNTLYVYSPSSDSGAYAGKPLDSNNARLLPSAIAEAYFQEPGNVFAIYRFKISKDLTGLIARTPSYYYPSSVKLLFYDAKVDSITGFVELSEEFGDAGDALSKVSWLVKKRENLAAFVSVFESHDHSVDDAQDSVVETSCFNYILDLSAGKVDTVDSNQKELEKVFTAFKN